MQSEVDLHALIGLIYEAAVEPAKWHDVLRRLHAQLRFGRVALINHDLRQDKASFADSFGHDASSLAEYGESWVRHDPGAKVLYALPTGVATATNFHYSDRDWRRTEYFNEFARRHEIYFQMGIVLAQDGQRNSFLGCARTRDEGEYSQEQIRALHILAPHLKRAFQIARQFSALHDQRGALGRTLDQVRIGIVFFDESERVVWANRVAESWFLGTDGLAVRGGRLEARDFAAAARLRRLIHDSVVTGLGQGMQAGGFVVFPEGMPGRRLIAHVYPFSPPQTSLPLANRRLCAVAFLSREGDAPPPSPELLRLLHGLTPAEARLAEALAHGRTLDEAAAHLQLSKETLRAQLKAVFGKTGTRRQAELVRLLIGTLAPIAPDAETSTEP